MRRLARSFAWIARMFRPSGQSIASLPNRSVFDGIAVFTAATSQGTADEVRKTLSFAQFCARRRWKVSRIRSARRRTPNLFSKLETWNFTVRSAIFRRLPISLLERFSNSESRHFLFAAAEIGNCVGLEATALAGENGIHETREQLAWHPETTASHQRQRADELFTGLDVGQKALHSQAKKRVTVGFIMLFSDDNQSCLGSSFHQVGEKRAGSWLGGMSVDYVNLGWRRFELRKSGARIDSSWVGITLKSAFARMRSNSPRTKGWGERIHTLSLGVARFVATVCLF